MAFGLDIGSNSIKLVQLAREGSAVRLVAAGVIATPARGMMSEAESDLVHVAQSIKKLIDDTKITTHDTNFALPENQAYTRLVTFPPLALEEIASAVQWQAEGYIPIPKKEAVIDYEVVKKTEQGVDVLLVATARKTVDKYMRVVSAAGLNAVAVETELIALTRCLAPAGKTAMIIDFGATSTDVAIAVDCQLVFSRSIPIGGIALTRAVAQGIGVEAMQAEEYKKTYGLSAQLEGKVKQALSPVVSQVLDEFKKARAFWQQEHPDATVQVGILTGGAAGLPEIAPTITASLGFEVTIGNPFASIGVDVASTKSLSAYAPLYAIAVGLALRGI